MKWDDLPWNTPLLACPGLEHGVFMTTQGYDRWSVDDRIRPLEADRVTWAETLVPGSGEFLESLLESRATPSSPEQTSGMSPLPGEDGIE